MCCTQTVLDYHAMSETRIRMQASTQQIFRDLLSRMGDQGRKKLTILLLGVHPLA